MLNTHTSRNPVGADDLKTAWRELLACQPHLRIRDAAATLGVGEAELLATGCGNNVVRLDAGDMPGLLAEVAGLGPVMALTRNDAAVHEKTGEYAPPSYRGAYTLIAGRRIDLCLALTGWHHAYAVSETSAHGVRDSLQFFGADGEAVHKIYLTEVSSPAAYRYLIDTFRSADQSPKLELARQESVTSLWQAPEPALPPNWQRWIALWRHAETAAANESAPVSLFRDLLAQLAATLLPVNILTASRAALQVHGGPIEHLKATGPWFNVLDPGFNLHLNEAAVDRLDLAHLHYQDHEFTGLLLRDRSGRTVAALCGDFDESHGESLLWRDFLAALPCNPA